MLIKRYQGQYFVTYKGITEHNENLNQAIYLLAEYFGII